MPDYKKMYFVLFNAVTSAIDMLQDAQNDGECAYVEGTEALALLVDVKDEKANQLE